MSKFWNFIKNQDTENSSESVELRIDGDIMGIVTGKQIGRAHV